jgi:hypothetical protein
MTSSLGYGDEQSLPRQAPPALTQEIVDGYNGNPSGKTWYSMAEYTIQPATPMHVSSTSEPMQQSKVLV